MDSKITPEGAVQVLMQDQIIDPVDPMRTDMDRDELYQLAENIKQNGLINPITVRPRKWCEDHRAIIETGIIDHHTCNLGTRYEVVAGHRRFTACKIAGKIRIECVIRELTDGEVFSVKAAENIERAEVDLLDESKFITEYMNVTGKTIPEIAKALNRSTSYVTSRLQIGLMPPYMQQGLKDGSLKLGVALKLNEITDEKIKEVWVGMAIRDGISVAQADYWLHGWRLNQLPGGSGNEAPPEGFSEQSPQSIKFRCDLSGQEDDVRFFRTKLIHESQLDTFNAIANEIQKPQSDVHRGGANEFETAERSEAA
jgi:ParB/RepB/Spo0J family partition protein